MKVKVKVFYFNYLVDTLYIEFMLLYLTEMSLNIVKTKKKITKTLRKIGSDRILLFKFGFYFLS